MRKLIITLSLFSINLVLYPQQKIKVYRSFDEIKPYFEINGDSMIYINFWASWCKPCVEEMPAIEKVRNEFKNQKIKFLLISLDDPAKTEKMVIPLINRIGIKSNVVLLDDTDYNSWIDQVDIKWTGAIPASLIINYKNKSFYERSFTYEELKHEIVKHLNQ